MTHEQMMDQNAYDNLRKENAMLRAQLAQVQAARTICDVHQAEFDRLEEQLAEATQLTNGQKALIAQMVKEIVEAKS